MKRLVDTKRSPTGFTLVELMIVVAVVGVLAAIAGISYNKYIKSAKISKLEQYAAEVASAQEQYKAQNSDYLHIDDEYEEDDEMWEELLGFSKNGLSDDITIETIAEGDCDDCEGAEPDTDQAWYAVIVKQDLNPSESDDTTVILHNELEDPVILNEGK
ncbi:MAG: type IV pilin protein [Persicimonas sp.]